jgi:hypothetical protein
MKLKTYSTQKFKEAMENIFPDDGYDAEGAHLEADDLMCQLLEELGYEEGVKIFKNAEKWYA